MKKIFKLVCLILILGLIFSFSSQIQAEHDYPERPIQIVVPWGPGGQSDLLARTITNFMRDHLPEPMVVANVEGAAGTVGRREVLLGNPDGYTLGLFHLALPINYHLGLADFNWDDFEPVAQIAESELFVVPRPDTDWETLEDLVEAMEEKPGEIDAGLSIGSWAHFATEALAHEAGVDYNLVSTGGEGDRITRLMSKEIDWNVLTLASAGEYVKGGEFDALAILTEERNEEFPNVPTAKELGYDVVMPAPLVLYAPKGLSEEVKNVLVNAFEEAFAEQETLDSIRDLRLKPNLMTGEELENYLRNVDQEMEQYKESFEIEDE